MGASYVARKLRIRDSRLSCWDRSAISTSEFASIGKSLPGNKRGIKAAIDARREEWFTGHRANSSRRHGTGAESSMRGGEGLGSQIVLWCSSTVLFNPRKEELPRALKEIRTKTLSNTDIQHPMAVLKDADNRGKRDRVILPGKTERWIASRSRAFVEYKSPCVAKISVHHAKQAESPVAISQDRGL